MSLGSVADEPGEPDGVAAALPGDATQDVRLLVDLLAHEVREAVQIGLLGGPFDVRDDWLNPVSGCYVVDDDAIWGEQRGLVLVQERHPSSVFEQCRVV